MRFLHCGPLRCLHKVLDWSVVREERLLENQLYLADVAICSGDLASTVQTFGKLAKKEISPTGECTVHGSGVRYP